MGRNRINIIPYVISSKHHPLVRAKILEVGDMDYTLDVMVHRNIGPSKSSVICLKSVGKPCPICELADKFKKEGKDKEAGSLKASRRVYYNVQDLKNDPDKVKVFEASHYLFEKELIEESRDEDGGFIEFAHVKKGKEITFKVVKEKKGTIEFNKFKNFNFEDREEPVTEDLLEQAVPFDKYMNILSEDAIENLIYGRDDDDEEEDEEDEAPAKRRRPRLDDDDDEDEEDELPKKRRRPIDDDDEEYDDDTDDEKPASKKKFDDLEDVKKECKKPCGKCPFGHKFGKDCDDSEDCDKCSIWDKCYDAQSDAESELEEKLDGDNIPF